MDLISGVADLHLHTTNSDGTCSVEDRIQQAREIGLEAIAITDHDTISNSLQQRAVNHQGLELITGVEVRADVLNTKVELIGYYIDPTDDDILDILKRVRSYRRDRNQKIINRLHEKTDLDRSYADIRSAADGILGRPYIANVLIEEGIVESVGSAFKTCLGPNGTAFVPMERVPAADVIEVIQRAGGVVSLAHPGRVRIDTIETIIEELVANRLDAIEVPYPYDESPSEGYADFDVEDAATCVETYDLLTTGGSDCHGPESGKFRIGDVRITQSQLTALREQADERRPF